MKTLKLSFLLLSVMALTFGMQGCKTAQNMPTTKLEGKWMLKSLNGQNVKEIFAGKNPTMIISLTDSRIHGTGGCNSYNGRFTLQKDEFSAPNLASTMMMCIQANQESQFLKALGETSKLSLNGDELTFTQNGQVVMVFSKAKPLSAADLSGTWTLQSMQGASANTYFDEQPPTITFDFNSNKVSGNAGCNRYSGPFKLDKETLDVTTPVATRMACDHLEGETKFLKLLSTPSKIEVEENMLVLKEDGRELLRFSK